MKRSDGRLLAQGHGGGSSALCPREEADPIADPPDQEAVEQQLAREILRIHEESYGKGAGTAKAMVGGDWVVVVLDELELLPNEKFLIDRGRGETVTQVRSQYQLAIQSSFSAAVERATGRRVVGFTSATSIEESGFVAEIFKLG
jgi:uncharacterized protein YbcI